MKGRALILIFLFLILINPVSATDNGDGTGQFVSSGRVVDEEYVYSVSTWYDEQVRQIYINDIGTMKAVSIVKVAVPENRWNGGTSISAWGDVDYRIGGAAGDIVATGKFGYNKGYPNYYVIAFFDDGTDLTKGGTYSGAQVLYITGNVPDIELHDGAPGNMYYQLYGSVDQATSTLAYFADTTGRIIADNQGSGLEHESTTIYSFENTYTYTPYTTMLNFTLDRSTASKSAVVITNSGGHQPINETAFDDEDIGLNDWDIDNSTWTVQVTNEYSTVFSDTITFCNQTGTIEFNQTFYTDPESIGVEWDIDNYDIAYNLYEIQIVTSVSGDPSQDSWPADGNWNTSPFISSASGAAVFDFYSDGYDLPIWIQGELWAQDKNTGTWTKLDNTPVVIYHKDTGDASISLNATYDVGDIALITWQAADEDADLIIQFTNLNTSYIYTMEPYIWIPGIQKFEKYFTNEYIGKIKVELIENGVTTAVAYTMVSSPTTPYIEWYNSEIPLGTDAYYSYYTDNSSDTIAIYGPNLDLDPPVFNELFNIFSAETGHHYLYTTTGGKDAGVWTISLLHDGTTYYNDTMMVTTADAFVRFDGDEFEMGDTIGITYQLSDFTDEIWMFDANNKMVVQFTCQWGALSIGGVRTVDYSLVDSNEYGHDIESLISAGHYETGTWKIYIVRNGILTSESDEWDITTIKSATSDPADTSNEMISIFFAPEGIFLIFTAALTVLGLAVTKHPGGGAACAVVGVGFGVFFKVLPVWMLLLMIITLVVLAGVSVAVYFRGK